MQVQLSNLGKRFNSHWIFKGVEAQLAAGQPVAITGPNGSGKSTLLQVIAGAMLPSAGSISWQWQGRTLLPEEVFAHTAICAPYLELPEELTLLELLQFHGRLKPWQQGLQPHQIIELLGLQAVKNRPLQQFSSGMRQRVKLAQAFCSQAALLLIDEPTTNLDVPGIALYHQLVERFANGRLLLVASNNADEISFCTQTLHIPHYQQFAQAN
ncbi:MAG TPA: ATP-binding cassette domain-containing protein [Phnomibacter sp.]|nr:ATP-binding cassette domain-containing protein [Phnomibacter sp.]